MKKIIQLLIISLVFLFSSCNNNSFLNNMSESIQYLCNDINDTCIVDLDDYTDFEWDKFYVFEEETLCFAIAETINISEEEIINHDEIGYEVRTFLFIFTFENKIVYAVDGRPDKMFFINYLPQVNETLNSFTTSKFKVVNLGNEHYNFIPILN